MSLPFAPLRFCVSLILFAVGLAGTAHAQTNLRLQFKEKDKLQYVLEQELKTSATIKDMQIESKMLVIWDVTWNVLGVDAGGAQMQVKIERARIFVEGPNGRAAADSDDKNEPEDAFRKGLAKTAKLMAAMDLRATMLSTGAVQNVKATADSLKALKDLGGPAKEEDVISSDITRQLIASTVMPADSIAKGKSWPTKTENKSAFGKMIVDSTYTYEGPIEADGVKLEKISIKSGLTLEPDSKLAVKVTLKDFKGTGHTLLDNAAGRMIETVTSQRTQLQLEAMGMTVTQTTTQIVTLRLKK